MALKDLIDEVSSVGQSLESDYNQSLSDNKALKEQVEMLQARALKAEELSSMSIFERNVISYLRTLPEKELLPKLYALTGDHFYLEQYQRVLGSSPSSSLDASPVHRLANHPSK